MTPKTSAVVHDLVKGNDGLIRSAHISTANHKTTTPITRLYIPWKLSAVEMERILIMNKDPPPVTVRFVQDPREQLQLKP